MSSGWLDPHRNQMDRKSTGTRNQDVLTMRASKGWMRWSTLRGRISVQADGLATEKHESLTAESKERGYFANRSPISRSPRRQWYPRPAIGYYGDRDEEILNEGSISGFGFLAEVCIEWEIATEPLAETEIRVVNLRMGIVLSLEGGPLEKMLPPFKMGVGGILGNGRQYMSWIALADAVGGIHHALVTDSLQGPVNNVAPHPVTNREFTKALGRVLRRPTLFPLPSFGLRLMFGEEMANELFLSSTRAEPVRLLETGYTFQYPELEGAVAACPRITQYVGSLVHWFIKRTNFMNMKRERWVSRSLFNPTCERSINT